MGPGHLGMHPSIEMQYRAMQPSMDMHMLAHHPAMGSRMEPMRDLHQDSGPAFTAPQPAQPSQEAGRALTFPDREPYISEETLARYAWQARTRPLSCSLARLLG